MSETKALARRDAFEPADMGQALEMARALGKGGLLPDGLKSAEAVFTVLVTGRELGLSAMQSIRSIHIIKGKPTLSADLMVGLVKRSPECEWFRLVESTDERAVYETQRRGEPKPTTMTFDAADAKRAGLTGGNWRSYPAAMLRARASSALARAVYPDVVGGIYDPDELGAEQERVEKDITPPARRSPLDVIIEKPAGSTLTDDGLRRSMAENFANEVGCSVDKAYGVLVDNKWDYADALADMTPMYTEPPADPATTDALIADSGAPPPPVTIDEVGLLIDRFAECRTESEVNQVASDTGHVKRRLDIKDDDPRYLALRGAYSEAMDRVGGRVS